MKPAIKSILTLGVGIAISAVLLSYIAVTILNAFGMIR